MYIARSLAFSKRLTNSNIARSLNRTSTYHLRRSADPHDLPAGLTCGLPGHVLPLSDPIVAVRFSTPHSNITMGVFPRAERPPKTTSPCSRNMSQKILVQECARQDKPRAALHHLHVRQRNLVWLSNDSTHKKKSF